MKSKIAFLCSSKSWSGLEMNHLKTATYLNDLNFEIFVFCQENTPIETCALEQNLKVVYIQCHKRYKYFFAGLKLKGLLKAHQISHLIVRNSSDLNICSIAKIFSIKKFHLSFFMEMQLGVSKKNFLHTSRFKKIDLWVCSTNFLKNQVLKFTKFPAEKIKIIPPSLNLSLFQKEISKENAREKLDLPSNKIIIGLIGRLDVLKGQHLLLKALSILKGKNLFVCFMGSPTLNENNNYFNFLKDYVESNNLQNQVVFLPFQEEVSIFYKAIDVCILATKSETFGMVTIESLTSGTPIIASNAGGTPEILENGKLGILFETENEIDLAEKINYFLKNIEGLNKAKIENAIQKYDYRQVLKEVIESLGLK
jgi:glycosyltransferase involved in cell wall biosynthesis